MTLARYNRTRKILVRDKKKVFLEVLVSHRWSRVHRALDMRLREKSRFEHSAPKNEVNFLCINKLQCIYIDAL